MATEITPATLEELTAGSHVLGDWSKDMGPVLVEAKSIRGSALSTPKLTGRERVLESWTALAEIVPPEALSVMLMSTSASVSSSALRAAKEMYDG